jgi:cellobiose-specific phosphotransferase system component IIC
LFVFVVNLLIYVPRFSQQNEQTKETKKEIEQ